MRFYYYWIAVAVLVIDYITKKLIATQLELGDMISVIGDFFIITSHRNTGAAFGILEGQRIFFILITLLIVGAIIWYIQISRKSAKAGLMIGLGLVLGGAIGNFYDRALYGEVVDFLMFNFGSYTFPIFNVADAAICCGAALIMLDVILSGRDEQKKASNGEDKENKDHEQQSV